MPKPEENHSNSNSSILKPAIEPEYEYGYNFSPHYCIKTGYGVV